MFFLQVSWLLKTRADFFKTELVQKPHKPSRAGRPVARAKSELSRAKLNSIATLGLLSGIFSNLFGNLSEPSFLARDQAKTETTRDKARIQHYYLPMGMASLDIATNRHKVHTV